jgi:hypothetical protein
MALKTVTEINRDLRYRLGMTGITIDDGASYYDVYGGQHVRIGKSCWDIYDASKSK